MSELIGKGSLFYRTEEELKFLYYGAVMEDCRIKVSEIFTKMLPDNRAAVYGEYTVYILFCYQDRKKGSIYMLQTIRRGFTQIVPFQTEGGAVPGADDVCRACFEPKAACSHLNNVGWSLEISGEITVTVAPKGTDVNENGEPVSAGIPKRETQSKEEKPPEEKARVWRVNSEEMPLDALLEMEPSPDDEMEQ